MYKTAATEAAATSVWFCGPNCHAKWQISYKSLSSNFFNCVLEKETEVMAKKKHTAKGIHITATDLEYVKSIIFFSALVFRLGTVNPTTVEKNTFKM